jgi:hypothetical protein
MKLDGTVTPTIADENSCFPKGKHVTWIDGESGQAIERISPGGRKDQSEMG